jgi:hypothetical protein
MQQPKGKKESQDGKRKCTPCSIMYRHMGSDVATSTILITSSNQDVNSLEELKVLWDDEITILFNAQSRLGWLTTNPTDAADLGQPAMIRRPGN